jgi:serine beta-lactamase-like protein LACTB
MLLLLGAAASPAAPASPSPAPSATPPPMVRRTQVEALQAAVRRVMDRHHIPGASASVVDGGVRFSVALGVADMENDVPVRPTTVFRLASISKTVTAIAVLQLAAEGKLRVDDPVQRHCRAYPIKRWPMTVRQLLSHQSGVRGYNPGEFNSTRHYASVDESLSIFREDALVFQPGTRFLYTAYGYTLAGCVVEGATGTTYMEAIRQRLLGPAGTTQTRDDDVYTLIPGRAQGYVRKSSGTYVNSALADTSDKVPGGGLAGSADDVARIGAALLDGTLLPHAQLEEMLTIQKLAGGKPTTSGLGLFLGTHNGQREAWHTGGQQRVSNVLYLLPDRPRVIALLTNLEGLQSEMPQAARDISDALDEEASSAP